MPSRFPGLVVPRRRAPDVQQDFLHDLLGLSGIAHYAADHAEHLAGHAGIDGFEGALIPAGHVSEQGAKLTVPRRRAPGPSRGGARLPVMHTTRVRSHRMHGVGSRASDLCRAAAVGLVPGAGQIRAAKGNPQPRRCRITHVTYR